MTHEERQRVVERFFDDRMSDLEKQQILAQAAGDEQLRLLLEAERALVRAVQRDRAALNPSSAQPGAELMARLSNTAPQASSSVASGLSGLGRSILFASVGAAAVLATIFILIALLSDSPDDPSAARSVAQIDPGSSAALPLNPGSRLPYADSTNADVSGGIQSEPLLRWRDFSINLLMHAANEASRGVHEAVNGLGATFREADQSAEGAGTSRNTRSGQRRSPASDTASRPARRDLPIFYDKTVQTDIEVEDRR